MLSWLRISPDIEIRLIGSASFEGPKENGAAYNQALAARRVAYVLKAAGRVCIARRRPDPRRRRRERMPADRHRTVVMRVAEWPPGTARPRESVVRVTFARNELTCRR